MDPGQHVSQVPPRVMCVHLNGPGHAAGTSTRESCDKPAAASSSGCVAHAGHEEKQANEQWHHSRRPGRVDACTVPCSVQQGFQFWLNCPRVGPQGDRVCPGNAIDIVLEYRKPSAFSKLTPGRPSASPGWEDDLMRFGSATKVLANCMVKYYRSS